MEYWLVDVLKIKDEVYFFVNYEWEFVILNKNLGVWMIKFILFLI